jgi:hypothetical protein
MKVHFRAIEVSSKKIGPHKEEPFFQGHTGKKLNILLEHRKYQ